MEIAKAELLGKLKSAYEMEEVMADLLTALALPNVLTGQIPEPDRQKVHKMLALIRRDTLEHKKIVSGMIEDLSGGSLGV